MFVVGCGSDAAPPPPSRQPLNDLLRCDITESECQQAIYTSVAERVGSDPGEPPPIRTISLEQYEAELREGVEPEDYLAAEPAARGLQLIGLMNEGATNTIDAQIENLVSWVGAYYRFDDQSITVIDRDYDVISAQTLLAHEFMHAVQDRDFGLGGITDSVVLEDDVLAVRSVFEGDAEFNSLSWTFEQLETPLTSAEWDEVHEDTKALLRGVVVDTNTSVIDVGGNFPYVHGTEFMGDAIFSEGLGVRRDLWASGPSTSAEVMMGFDAFRNGVPRVRDTPESVYPTAPLEYEEVVYDELGAWTLFVFLHHFGIGQDLAWSTALASTGDAFGVYESESDTVAVWRLRFEETEVDVANVLETALDGVPTPGLITFVADGGDLVIVAAETQLALENWFAEPMEPIASRIEPKSGRRPVRRVVSKTTCAKSHRDVSSHLAAHR